MKSKRGSIENRSRGGSPRGKDTSARRHGYFDDRFDRNPQTKDDAGHSRMVEKAKLAQMPNVQTTTDNLMVQNRSPRANSSFAQDQSRGTGVRFVRNQAQVEESKVAQKIEEKGPQTSNVQVFFIRNVIDCPIKNCIQNSRQKCIVHWMQ